MKKPFLIGTSLFMVVLIVFVYFSQPIKAKADQLTLNYQTTSSSLSEVKAMITGMEAALIPIVFIVIGFLALTYCTLRNVNVPIKYPSGTSFIDKCSELGQYCFDHATDALKPVLYSVYEFIASGQVVDPSRLSSTLPFLITSVGKFFGAFGTWLSSSFINNVQPIADGLLDQFKNNPLVNLNKLSPANEQSAVNYINSNYPQYDISHIFGGNYQWIYISNFVRDIFVGVQVLNNTTMFLYFYKNIDGVLHHDSFNFQFYDGISLSEKNQYYIRLWNSEGFFSWVTSFFTSMGFPLFVSSSYPSELSIDDISIVNDVVTTPWSDQVYSPTDDELGADIDDIADKLGEGATIGSLAALIALLTQDKSLTLGTALTDVQTINSAGDYNFPSMDNIWKYPQYFFDMLHGWGVFVKGCLGSVTVGEGGLSWIFYGGFVLLICGGIIGKILLG